MIAEPIAKSTVQGSIARRLLRMAEWAVPSAALALMPKCPACVAAYVALATGIGLSTAVAGYLRTFLIAVCAISLCLAALRRARPYFCATRTIMRAASSS